MSSRPSRLALPFAAILTAAVSAQTAPPPLQLTDLSESGNALAFRIEQGDGPLVTVQALAASAWDVTDFEVAGAEPGSPILFRVPAPQPWWQPTTSEGNFEWKSVMPVEGPPGELRFAVVPHRSRFTVRLGSLPRNPAPYYDYARFTNYIAQIQAEPLAQVTQLGTSIQGRPIYRIIIDPPSRFEKKTVLMTVRQHGNEDGSSYVLEGALDHLLSRAGQTPNPDLLRKVRWIIYPLCNPDGAVANQRGNANGTDLNRNWRRAGCSGAQEPEINLIQCDVEMLHATFGIDIAGDHHGWGNSNHGGFRYAQGQSVSFVTVPEYQEARKDTTVITRHDPTQFAWQENGGATGMIRAELYHRFKFLIHTPEYNDTLSTPAQFHIKGAGWTNAMLDTLYAPRFTDGQGNIKKLATLPDQIWITVDDDDENQSSNTRETVQVTIREPRTGDLETLTLLETGNNTGVFRNTTAIPLVSGTATQNNGILESGLASRLIARYQDDDYPRDASGVLIPVEPEGSDI